MKKRILGQGVEAIYQRIERLRRRILKDPAESAAILPQALKELQVSLEKLGVAEEELRQQTEELLVARDALEAERKRYADLFEFAPDAYVVTDAGGIIREANRAAEGLLGLRAKSLQGKPLTNCVAKDDRRDFRLMLARAGTAGQAVRQEFRIKPRGRPAMPIRSTLSADRDSNGKVTAVRWIIRDITGLKEAEEALRRSEERLRRAVENYPDSFVIFDAEGKVEFINAHAARLSGLAPEKMVGHTTEELLPPEATRPFQAMKKRAFATGKPQTGECHLELPGGEFDVVLFFIPLLDEQGEVRQVLGITHDITERKEAERYQALTARLLEQLNRPGAWPDVLGRITREIQEATGFEAVGIRLREGDDFPYFVTEGFAGEFVRAESSLCERGPGRKPAKDEQGHPVLQCVCGTVLAGRTDPSKPFFTEGGSFWTNSTTDLLASTPDKDLGRHLRGRCNRAGYESVALVPIRSGAETIGLMQLNGFGRNRLTPTMIGFLEQIGASIGMAIRRHRAESDLADTARFPAENPNPIFRIASDGTLMYANAAAAPRLAELGCIVGGTMPGPWGKTARDALESGKQDTVEVEQGGRAFSVVVVPVAARGYVNLYGYDITPLKRAQEDLRQARDRLEEQVARRTAELSETVDTLQSEIQLRRITENQLRENSELLERVFAAIHLSVVYLDKDFNFIRVNQTYADACGHEPEFFVGKNHFDLYPHEENEAIFRRVVKTGEPFTVFAKPFVFPDDPEKKVTYWDWTLAPVHDAAGRVSGLVFTLLNVTEQHEARQKLEAERRRLYDVLNMLPGFVYLRDRDYGIRFANRRFEELFGKPEEKRCYELLHGRSVPCETCLPDQTATTGEYHTYERTYANGRTYRVHDLPFSDVDGAPLLLRLGLDVTDQKHLEREVAEVAGREQRRISQDLHDVLGQQLTGVAFLARAMARKLEAKSIGEAAEASAIAEFINEAIRQTRALARGLCPVDLTAEGLVTALKEYAASVTPLFEANCTFDCPAPVPIRDVNVATQVYYIAQEAVTNAIRHGRAKNITIRLAESDGLVTLEVKDDGSGLPDKGPADAGMGLHIMNYRAGIIGGTLEVGSEAGRGVTVACRFRRPDGRQRD